MHKKSRFLTLSAFLISLSALIGCSPNTDPKYHPVIYEYNTAEDLLQYYVDPEGYQMPIIINNDFRGAEFVKEGELAHEPEVTFEGAEPEGWYADYEYTTKFDFSQPITEDTHVWAKWKNTADLRGVKWNASSVELFNGDFSLLGRALAWNTTPINAAIDESKTVYEEVGGKHYLTTKTIKTKTYLYANTDDIGNEPVETSLKVTVTGTREGETVTESDTMKVIIKPAKRVTQVNVSLPEQGNNISNDGTHEIKLDMTAEPREYKFSWTLSDENGGTSPTNSTVFLWSDDENVATVSETSTGNATVKFLGTSDVTIYVLAQNSKDGTPHIEQLKFVHTKDLKSIQITTTSLYLATLSSENAEWQNRKSGTVKAKLTPEDATQNNLEWYTSNENVATVVQTGGTTTTVTSTDTPGTATISTKELTTEITSLNSCLVTVVRPIDKFEVDQSQYTINVNDTATSILTINDGDEAKKPSSIFTDDIKWESADENIATVDQNGKITAKKPGTTTIKVFTNYSKELDSGFSKTITVTVNGVSGKLDKDFLFFSNNYKVSDTLALTLNEPFTKEEVSSIDWYVKENEYKDYVTISTSENGYKATINSNVSSGKYCSATIVAKITDIYGGTQTSECAFRNYDTSATWAKLTHELDSSSQYVVSANGNPTGSVVLASAYNDIPVYKIKASGFAKKTNINDVFIPSSIKTVDNAAFQFCTNLDMVLFSPSKQTTNELTSIGSYAFGCSSSEKGKLEYIGLEYCDQLSTINNNAFEYQEKLSSINIPKNVTSIGTYAFRGCSTLESITFAGTMTQWKNKVTKGSYWASGVATTVVHCSDGDVTI